MTPPSRGTRTSRILGFITRQIVSIARAWTQEGRVIFITPKKLHARKGIKRLQGRTLEDGNLFQGASLQSMTKKHRVSGLLSRVVNLVFVGFSKLRLSVSTRTLTIFAVVLVLAPVGALSLGLLNNGDTQAAAGINDQINFQARLLTSGGGVVADGNYNVEFKIYQDGDGDLGGGDETLQWTEAHLNNNSEGVTIRNGYLSAALGSITSLSSVDFNQDTLWLSVNIGDTNGTCTPFSNCNGDGEMDPFMRFTSTPYALNSDELDGLDSTDFVQLGQNATPQAVNTTNSAIAVNQTGTGNLIQLQDGGTDRFVIADGGAATLTGTLTVSSTGVFQGASVTVGTSSQQGDLILNDGSSNTITIRAAAHGQNTIVTIPDAGGAADTFCLQTLDNCGAGSVTLQEAYDNGNTITTTDARDIDITLADTATDSSFTIDILGTTNVFAVQDNGTTIFEVADGGSSYFQTTTDSTTGFQILDSDGGTSVLNVDTTNERVGIGTDAPGYELEVIGDTRISSNLAVGANPLDVVGILAGNTFTGSDDCTFGCNGIQADITIDNPTDATGANGLITRVIAADSSFTLGTATGLRVRANADLGSATITNNYGIYIEDQTVGTNNYGLAIQGGDTYALYVESDTSRFEGPVVFQNDADSITSFQVLDSDGGDPVLNVDTTNERLGIGTNAPGYQLHVVETSTSGTGATEVQAQLDFTDTGAVSSGTDTTFGLDVNVVRTGATGGVIESYGGQFTVFGDTGGDSQGVGLSGAAAGTDDNIGVNGLGLIQDGDTVDTIVGVYGVAGTWTGVTSGTATTAVGLQGRVNLENGSGATVTNGYGLLIQSADDGSNTITNNYGIYVQDQTEGGTDYGIYVEDAEDYSLYLASTDGDAASGITFGGDTNLYRSSANFLRTSDSLTIDTGLDVDGRVSLGTGDIPAAGNATVRVRSVADDETALEVRGFSATQSANIFEVRNSAGTVLVRVEPDGDLTIGADGENADLKFNDGNGGEIVTIRPANFAGDFVLTIPDAGGADTFCLQTLDNCGAASVTLQEAYDNGNNITTTDARDIEFDLADTATDADFIVDIQGTGNTFQIQDSGTAVLTVADGGAATFQNTTNSNDAFVVAASGGGTVLNVDTINGRVGIGTGGGAPGGRLAVQGASSGSTPTLLLNNSTSTGDIASLRDNGTVVLTVADGGATTFQNSVDSTTALQVLNAAGTSLINVDTSTTNNLLTNGGFENGTTGWAAKGSGSIAQDSTYQWEGNDSLAITTTAAANDGAEYDYTFSASTEYTLSFYARLVSGSMTTLDIGHDDNGADIDECTSNTLSNSGWAYFSCTFTTGGTIGGGSNIYINQSDATARTFYIDGVTLEQAATAAPYQNGIISLNGVIDSPLQLQNQEDSTRALQVVDSSDNDVFIVDTISGSVGIGDNSAPSAQTALHVSDSVGGADGNCVFGCYGIVSLPVVYDSANDNLGVAYLAQVQTAAESFTLNQTAGLSILNPSVGAGSAITSNYGISVGDQTAGTNDYGIAIAGADTYALWVGSGADNTDAANGITFGATAGTSANLYRGADNQLRTDDDVYINSATDSQQAFRVAGDAGVILRVDSEDDDVFIGGSSLRGDLLISDGSSDYVHIQSGNQTDDRIVSIPDNISQNDTFCLQTEDNCGAASVTLQEAYDNGNNITTTDARDIEFDLADTATDADFIVDLLGTGNTFEVRDAGTAILSVVDGGATTLTNTGGGTDVALTVNGGTSTGNILDIQDNGTSVLTVADGGDVTVTSNNITLGNNADANTSIVIDSGSTATQQSSLAFQDQGANEWVVFKSSSNNFDIYESDTSISRILLVNSSNTSIRTGSATADFLFQNNSSEDILTINQDGWLIFEGATADGNEITLEVEDATADVTYQLEDAAAGTYQICTTASVCTGYGAGNPTLQQAYESGNSITATNAEGDLSVELQEARDFVTNITGTGSFVVQDSATNVFEVADGGAATFTNPDGTDVALTVNGGTSTGNILNVQDNGTNVFVVNDGGDATFQNNSDSTYTLTLDSGSTATQTTYISLEDQGDIKWRILKNGANNFAINDQDNTVNRITLAQGAETEFRTGNDTSQFRFRNSSDEDLLIINQDGDLVFEGATADSFETTIEIIDPTADVTYNLQTASTGTYNICTTATVCTGYAASTLDLQDAYDNGNNITTSDATDIEFDLADTATDANFIVDIQGTGNTFQVQDAGTAILTVADGGATTLTNTGGGTDVALTVNGGTSTGNILEVQDNGTNVFVIADGGDATLTGNFLPGADDTYDLGSSTARWQDLYLGPNSLDIGTDGDSGTISYDTTNDKFVVDQDVEIDAQLQVGDGGDSLSQVISVAGAITGYATLDNYHSSTQTSERSYGSYDHLLINPGGANSATNYADYNVIRLNSANNFTGLNAGVFGYGYNASTGTVDDLYGVNATAQTNNASATTTTLIGVNTQVLGTSGTTTSGYGLRVESAGGTIGTNYGIYVQDQTAGSTDYGIYVADAEDYSLYLASTDGDAASGITFGGDTNLYRGAANTLDTDDSLNLNGGQDAIQLLITGNASQSADLLVIENSSNEDLLVVGDNGAIEQSINLDPEGLGYLEDTNLFGAPYFSGARRVEVVGDVAYVTATVADTLTAFDVSDPTSPTVISEIRDQDSGSYELDGAYGLAVRGQYAYVTGLQEDSLAIIDISDPGNMVYLGDITDADSSVEIEEPAYVSVVGSYAYVASKVDDSISIIDISDPTNPTGVGFICDSENSCSNNTATTLENTEAVDVVGNIAYATSLDDNGVSVIDVSDPTNPTEIGSVDDGTIATLTSATDIEIDGRYAYVSSAADDAITVLDITDPSSITSVGSVSDGTELDLAQGITLAGKYAYVAAYNNDSIAVVDISDPTTPVIVGDIQASDSNVELEGIWHTNVYDNKLFASSYGNIGGDGAALSIIDLGGATFTSANIGSLKVNEIEVSANLTVQQNLDVGSGVTVGAGGILSQGMIAATVLEDTTGAGTLHGSKVTVTDTGIVTTGTDTTFGQVIDVTRTGATGGTINTTGLDIDVVGDTGGTSTVIGLDVNVSGADTNYAAIFQGGNVGIGDATPSEALSVTGNATVSGTFDVNGRSAFGDTTVPTNSTVRIVPVAATDRGLIIRAATGQSAALLEVTDDGGDGLAQFSSAGQLRFADGAGGSFDTNLYRSAADTLATDDSLVVGTDLTVNGNNVTFDNGADSALTVTLDSGSSATQTTDLDFSDQGDIKWQLTKSGSNNFAIVDQDNSVNRLFLTQGAGSIFRTGDDASAFSFQNSSGEDLLALQSDGNLQFEGATADGFETTLEVVDPTADITFRLEDASTGTYDICTTASICTGYASTTSVSLQAAYDNGQTILTDDDEGDLAITVAEATNFTVDVTGTGEIRFTGAPTAENFGNLVDIDATTTDSAYNPQSATTSTLTVSPGAASSQSYYGLYGQTTTASTNLGSATLTGLQGSSDNTGTGTIGAAYGVAGVVQNQSTGTITNAAALIAYAPQNGSGTITNNYGLYVNNITGGDTDYGIYVLDADDHSLYLASTDGDAASGITFGSDTNLYRNAANTLHTDDAFEVGDTFDVTSTSTFGGNVTLNSDVSLIVTGGATLPGSPTEGEVFYDSTNNVIYIYDGSEWDVLNGGASTATVVVAASDSLNGESADYIATGSSDETEINQAIDAVNTAGGGTVLLLEGTFTIDGTIDIDANVELVGSGNGTVITVPNSVGAMDIISEDSNPLNIALRNFKIDGNEANQGASVITAINLEDIAGGTGDSAEPAVVIDSITIIDNNYTGIELDNVQNARVSNNFIANADRQGIHIINGSKFVTIDGNQIFAPVFNGILVQNATTTDIVITNNTVQESPTAGVQVNAGQNISITGNTIRDGAGEGVYLIGAASYVTVSSNVIADMTGRGVYVNSGDYNTITGNTIEGGGSSGIVLGTADHSTVSNNIIHNSSAHGIALDVGSMDNSVIGNNIHNSGQTGDSDGISISNSDRTSIIGNQITDTAGTGSAIEIVNTTAEDTYISNNTFSGTGAESITDGGTDTIIANQLNAALGDTGADLDIQAPDDINLLTDTYVTGDLTVSQELYVGDGSNGTPSLSFTNDTDTGIYSSGADQIGFTTGGTLRWYIDASGHIIPQAASTYDLGGTSNEIRSIYVGDDTGINFGLDQDVLIAYDETTDNRLEITGTNANVYIEDSLEVDGHSSIGADSAPDFVTNTALYNCIFSFCEVTGEAHNAVLIVEEELTDLDTSPDDQNVGIQSVIKLTPDADAASDYGYGIHSTIDVDSSNTENIGGVIGIATTSRVQGSGDYTLHFGNEFDAINDATGGTTLAGAGAYGGYQLSGAGNVTDGFGLYGALSASSTATGDFIDASGLFGRVSLEASSTSDITNAYGAELSVNDAGSGSITTAYGVAVTELEGATTNYGFHVTNLSTATTNYGLYVDHAASGTDYGLHIVDAETASINLASTDGDAASGITFGGDVNIYRSAANILRTDDSLDVANEIYVSDGTDATDPSYTFQSDQDTGLYLIGAGDLGISTGGTLRVNIDTELTTADGVDVHSGGDLYLDGIGDIIDFAEFTGDKIQLYSNTYGIGLETNTLTNWAGTQFRWRIGGTSVSSGTQALVLSGSQLEASVDFELDEGADRVIRAETRSSDAAGRNLTVAAGQGGAGSGQAGGVLALQGGAAGGTNANGGNVTLSGGAGAGTGVNGLVVISNPTVSTASTQNCTGTPCAITQANIDTYGSVLITTDATGYTVTLGDPTITTAGRMIYVTNADTTDDFTLSANAGAETITLKPGTTATMIWGGSDWTAAGASSSTDLQAAYDNTAASAGAAELVLNAPGGNADGLTIRNNATTPIEGGLLEVQASIGNNLFAVNNFGTEYAANGGAEDDSSFSTDWVDEASATTSRDTTAGDFATGLASVQVVTTANAADGVENDLATNLATSTTYQVSFTGRLDSGAALTTLEVAYSPDGGTTETVLCTNYSSQTLVTTNWTKITCDLATDGTAVTDSRLIIRQDEASIRNFNIDNLSIRENSSSSTPPNVQIGGGENGGAVTLFTLDQASSPPVASGDSTYYGSMYYDTVTGRIQCYEADGWGACGSPPNNIITITPEYSGAVLNGSGVGTMSADFCSDETGVLEINATLCDSGEAVNYYEWTSPQATAQTYSIYLTFQLPSTFQSFIDNNTITLDARTTNTGNSDVDYQVFRSTGSAITECDSSTTVTSSDDTWQTVSHSGDEADSCGFSAGDRVIFKINMVAQDNDSVYVSDINFTYTNE